MGTPQELKLSTAYKTVRRKFCQSILKWSGDDSVKEEVSISNCDSHSGSVFNLLYLDLYCKLRHKIYLPEILGINTIKKS